MANGTTRTTLRLGRYAVPLAAFLMLPLCPGRSGVAESPPDPARRELGVLKSRAAAGDKRAQLELGGRYERGDGVPVDLNRAARLYTAAGSDSGGATMMFVPQKNGSVSAIPTTQQNESRGLPEARSAWTVLCEKRSKEKESCLEKQNSDGFLDEVFTRYIPTEDRGECPPYHNLERYVDEIVSNDDLSAGDCIIKIRRSDLLRSRVRSKKIKYLQIITRINRTNLCSNQIYYSITSLSSDKFITPLISAAYIRYSCNDPKTATDLLLRAYDMGAFWAKIQLDYMARESIETIRPTQITHGEQ